VYYHIQSPISDLSVFHSGSLFFDVTYERKLA
jgi:hypothetical protein